MIDIFTFLAVALAVATIVAGGIELAIRRAKTEAAAARESR